MTVLVNRQVCGMNRNIRERWAPTSNPSVHGPYAARGGPPARRYRFNL